MSTLASLLPQLREVALDATGTPMAGALLYTYAAGTSTPLATYSDSALTTLNPNPVVANSGGLFPAIYLQNAGYKVDLQSSAAVSLFTQDNVYPAAYIATQAVVPVIQTTTLTGTQNDFALTTGCSLLRVNNASSITFSGFSAGTDGQRLRVVSIGAGQVDLAHQSASSSAANRLINYATSAATSLAAGVGTADYVYDATTVRWRLVAHEQGTWISWAGTATATSLTNGSVSAARYRLSGRTCSVYLQLTNSGTMSATAGTTFIAGLPFTVSQPAVNMWTDNGAVSRGTSLVFTTGTGEFFVPTLSITSPAQMFAQVEVS